MSRNSDLRRWDWVQPAPFEVERPRLPWWTMLPGRLLLIAAPVITAVLLARLLKQIARRLYRYPVLILGAIGMLALGAVEGWTIAIVVVADMAALGMLWWHLHPASFAVVERQLRSEGRRLVVYAPGWRRTVRFSELHKRAGRSCYYPQITRVRSDGWRDRVSVKLLRGQCPDDYAHRASQLAHSFGATSCRIRVERPRRICLDFLHRDPLTAVIEPPPLAHPATVVDLRKVLLGVTEAGRPWRVRLLGRHLLFVASTGAGKSSGPWSMLWHLAPAIRSGLIQVFGIDPKGGMELGRAPDLFTRLVYNNGIEAVELLEHIATLTRQRAEQFRRDGVHEWHAGTGAPCVLLIVDELADVIAYQPDAKLRARANMALQTITSQGRAPGVCVIGEVQDPRKGVIDFRHLFPIRVALRLDEPDQVDLVLGDGARDRGAACHEIDPNTPGVGWVKVDGHPEPVRVRAFHLTDTHLAELTAYITHGSSSLLRLDPRRLDHSKEAGHGRIG
jgi:DNA segregation ATPase FtsK/SpoIIIE, S-DNA-T family